MKAATRTKVGARSASVRKAILFPWTVLFLSGLWATASWGDTPPPDWYQANTNGFISGYGPSDVGSKLFVFDDNLYAQNSFGLYHMENVPTRSWSIVTPAAPPNGPGPDGEFIPLGNYLYGYQKTQTWWIAAGSDPGGSWNRVTGLGLPAGASPQPRALFDGHLYGTHAMVSGTYSTFEIWRTSDIGMTTANWEQVVGNGFEDPVNNDSADLMIVYDSKLYAGVGTLRGIFGDPTSFGSGVSIWESSTGDSGTWSQVNEDGFGTLFDGETGGVTNFPIHQVIGAAAVYQAPGQDQEYLYIGTKAHFGAEIWRYDGSGLSGWTNVTPPWGGPGFGPFGTEYFRVEDMAVFQDGLFAAEGFPSANLGLYDGTSWSVVVDGKAPFTPDPINSPHSGALRSSKVLGDRLYVSTAKQAYVVVTNGDQVWTYPLAANSWTNTGDGKWAISTNWSMGTPGASNVCYITNAASKTIRLQSRAGSAPLTVTHLVLGAPGLDINTLIVSNLWESPFRITDGFHIDEGGEWILEHGATQNVQAINAHAMDVTGTARIQGGYLETTNGSTRIGGGNGLAVVSGGQWRAGEVSVGTTDAPAQGALSITGGSLLVEQSLALGAEAGSTGVLTVSSGTLDITNATGNAALVLGPWGHGELNLNGGTIHVDQLYGIIPGNVLFKIFDGSLITRQSLVANGESFVVGDMGGDASLSLIGNTHLFQEGFSAAHSPGSTGTIHVLNATLQCNDSSARIGDYGHGLMILSNSAAGVGFIQAGWWPGSEGAVEVSGGTLDVNTWISLGDDSATTGRMWLADGGHLTVSNGTLFVGGRYGPGMGTFILSNGTVFAESAQLGSASESVGFLTMNTGTFSSASFVRLGNNDCTASGFVDLYAGSWAVTNSAHTGVLEVCSGRFVQHGGTVRIDNLVLTNTCGGYDRLDGILRYGHLELSADLDADGDGLPNAWEQEYELDALSSAGENGPDGDPDADGQSNDQELKAGTAPNDPLSVFRITSLIREGSGMRVLWTTSEGHSYVVQTNDVLGGIVDFRDGSSIVPAPGLGEGHTNWAHQNILTNPATLYRIRIAQ